MEKEQIRKNFKKFAFHARIAFRGFCRMLYGAMAAGLIALAVYGFVCIRTETGWAAVSDFITACATLIVGLLNMYIMGGRNKGGKK